MSVIRITSQDNGDAVHEEPDWEKIHTQKAQVQDGYEAASNQSEVVAWRAQNEGLLSVRMEVGGVRDMALRYRQKRILEAMSSALHEKGVFVRDYCNHDNFGYYQWDRFILRGTVIMATPFSLENIEPLLKVIQTLDEAGWYPEPDIEVQYSTTKGSMKTVANLINILKSRQPLIEEALCLEGPMKIIIDHGVALGITLSAFSYTAVEAAAFLLEQAWKMALTTGKARMKPCDMSNPRYQMRSWLLRLGFIGERYERPRRTLQKGLAGDCAFFSEGQKEIAAAKRKARKLNGIPM